MEMNPNKKMHYKAWSDKENERRSARLVRVLARGRRLLSSQQNTRGGMYNRIIRARGSALKQRGLNLFSSNRNKRVGTGRFANVNG